jgi:hypothetical protein
MLASRSEPENGKGPDGDPGLSTWKVRCWGNSDGLPDEWNNGGCSHVDLLLVKVCT